MIAWAPEDRPTDEQIGAVLDEFEKTAWAGLEPDRYAWTAVLHREHGDGVHVHILTATLRPGDRPQPEHRSPRLGEDLRHAARRLQPPARLGLAPTIRRGPGRTSPATAPIWRRGSCGPASSTKPAHGS